MGVNLSYVDLGDEYLVDVVTLGTEYSCALSLNRSVKCWGAGTNGRLGYGNTFSRGGASGEMGSKLPTLIPE